MLFSRSSSSPTSLQCHFCLSISSFRAGVVPTRPTPTTRAGARRHGAAHSSNQPGFKWLCERCSCWNGWDASGETLTDHYAMHDAAENRSSYSKRATAPTNHFPSPSPKSPFCTSCTTNHSLIMNLLANFLPDEQDPTYPDAIARLPAYKDSVYERYPPICAKCEPVAEEVIRRGDYRAQTSALNGFLNKTRLETSGSEQATAARPPTSVVGTFFWGIRGALWTSTVLLNCALLTYALVLARPPTLPTISWAPKGSLIAVGVLSILWLGWDPLARVASKRPPGWVRRQRTTRKQEMILLYPIRLATASLVTLAHDGLIPEDWWSSTYLRAYLSFHLAIEALVFLTFLNTSFLPPPIPLRPIKLTRSSPPTSHSLSSTLNRSSSSLFSPPSPNSEPSAFPPTSQPPTSLDIFGRPHHPLFGAPPTWPNPPHNTQTSSAEQVDDTAMDWTPIPSSSLGPTRPQALQEDNDEEEDQTWKLFNKAPTVFGRDGKSGGHEGTGLERLLEGWGLSEATFGAAGSGASASSKGGGKGWGLGSWFGSGSPTRRDR